MIEGFCLFLNCVAIISLLFYKQYCLYKFLDLNFKFSCVNLNHVHRIYVQRNSNPLIENIDWYRKATS